MNRAGTLRRTMRVAIGLGLVSGLSLASALAHATTPEAVDTAAQAEGKSTTTTETQGTPKSAVPELDLLTFYKDNYILTGFTYATEVKFQFSAKFDLWPNSGPHAFYFAFSQKTLWDVYRKSAPFLESNYAPELFYSYFHAPGRYEPKPGCAFFMARLGAAHESDGEAGAKSRGWNRIFGESRYACYTPRRNYAALTLQVWAPPFGTRDNPNITSYLGYGELTLGVGSDRGLDWLGDWEIAVHARKGTRSWGAGSIEADARWRPRYSNFWRFTPYLYGQFFTGYGETLLSYDRALTATRLGIGFSDRSTRSE